MGNVKCGFSEKYRPLLQDILNKGEADFIRFITDHFIEEDVEKIKNEFLGGISITTAQEPKTKEIEKVNSRTGKKIDVTQDDAKQYYRFSHNDFLNMRNGFRKNLVSFSIYDIQEKRFLKENEVVGNSEVLNDKIFAYKVELLRKISPFEESIEDLKSLSPQDLNGFFIKHILNFEATINNDHSGDLDYKDAFSAYTILKTFDNLLENYVPFIKVKPEFTNSSPYINGRYIYKGPTVQFYTGFSSNEFADQAENISQLAKILLNYFPEVTSDGTIVESSSITLPGFNSIMSKFKAWIDANRELELNAEGEPRWTIQDELDKGVERDMRRLLEEFAKRLENTKLPEEHKTYLINKLHGIITYLYDANMQQDIKNMFTHLSDKTVQSDYTGYQTEKVGNETILRPVTYTERPIKLQADAISEIVESASKYWQENKKLLDKRLEKYNTTYNSESESITIKTPTDSIVITRNDNGQIAVSSNYVKIPNFKELLSEISCMSFDDDVENVISQIYSNEHDVQSLYLPIVANIILNANKTSSKLFKITTGEAKDLGRVLSVINGSDLKSVIKNGEGNNLPLYQQLCLAYRTKDVIHEIKLATSEGMISPYNDNLIVLNEGLVYGTTIRTDVTVGNTTRNVSDLPADDIMTLAIGQDFIYPLLKEQSHREGEKSKKAIIGLQLTTYSDKNKHFIMKYDINQDLRVMSGNETGFDTLNIKDTIDKYIKSGNPDDLKPLFNAMYYGERSQVRKVIDNIVADYNDAGFRFNKSTGKVLTSGEIELLKDRSNLEEISSLDQIKSLFAREKVNDISVISIVKESFKANNIDFVEEFHASKINGQWTVNETIEFMRNITEDKKSFKEFLENQYNQFKTWSTKAWKQVTKDPTLANYVEETKGNADRFLHAYFLTDIFLSNELSKVLVGNVYAHPNKNSETLKEMQQKGKEPDYYVHSFSSRWVAQVKRMVILGATYHSYAQGMTYGVPKMIKMAVMSDEGANIHNYFGAGKPIDANDGAGLTSPHFSRMQNVSLIDASVGGDKKTIYHHINPKFGLPLTLKWAEYEITNEGRRNACTTSLENLYYRMHNLKFDKSLNYEQSFDNLYYEDPINGKLFRIDSIKIENGIATRVVTEVNESGFPGEQYTQTIQEINRRNTSGKVDSIYDIDQLFGGAWAKVYDESTSSLQFTESNLDLITKFICDEDLKDYMIGWVVNKSAIKVGSTNINDSSVWQNDDDLWYTEMSTQFGGLQMNADHEYDDADVTEPSQMISALEQNGYTHDLATKAYEAIGKIVYESVADIQAALKNTDPNVLYKIFGKAVIESFATGNRETLGLAQAFVRLAEQSLKENNLDYKLPTSSASINGIFNSTVTSTLIKKAIRRHYAGISSVLHPAYNTMQFFQIGNNKYRYQDAIRVVRQNIIGTEFEPLIAEGKIEEFFKSAVFKFPDGSTRVSPFTEIITMDNPIDFEDTIVIMHEQLEDGTYKDAFGNITDKSHSYAKIDSLEKLDKYKYATDTNSNVVFYRWTLAPRNLKGSDTKFTFTTFDGLVRTASILDTDEAITIRLLNNVDWSKRTSGDNKKLSDSRFIYEQIKNHCISKYGNNWTKLLGIASRTLGLTNLNKEGDSADPVDKEMNISVVKRDLKRRIQKLLNRLSDIKKNPNVERDNFTFRGEPVTVTNINVSAAQIMMGKLYAKQLGLLPGDSLAKIRTYQDEYTQQGMNPGVAFFRNRIAGYYQDDNYDYKSYDWILFDGTGNRLYVKLETDEALNNLGESKYRDVNGDIYFEDRKVCTNAGKKFYTYYDSDGIGHQLCVVKNVESFNDLKNSGMFSMTQRNYRPDNYQVLAQEEYPDNNMEFVYRKGNKEYTKLLIDYYDEISNAGTIESRNRAILNLVQVLTDSQTIDFERKLQRQAKDRYESLEKSLRFIGTRIPCQNMTSFAAMEVIEFTDDEVNRIYLPPQVTYLQGSDFDEVTSK